MSSRVLATKAAVDAAQRMRAMLDGQMQQQVHQLISSGQMLSDTACWDGAEAVAFRRSTWPQAQGSLLAALRSLESLQAHAERVLHDIMAAGTGPSTGLAAPMVGARVPLGTMVNEPGVEGGGGGEGGEGGDGEGGLGGGGGGGDGSGDGSGSNSGDPYVSGEGDTGTFLRYDGTQWTVNEAPPEGSSDPFVPGDAGPTTTDDVRVGNTLKDTLPDDVHGTTKADIQNWQSPDSPLDPYLKGQLSSHTPDYSIDGEPADLKTVSNQNQVYQRILDCRNQGAPVSVIEVTDPAATEATLMDNADYVFRNENNPQYQQQRIIFIEPDGDILDCRWDATTNQVVATRYAPPPTPLRTGGPN